MNASSPRRESPDVAIANALPMLSGLAADIKALRSFVKGCSEHGSLPYQLTDLPIRLQYIGDQCRSIHNHLAETRKFSGTPPRTASPSHLSRQNPTKRRTVSTQTQYQSARATTGGGGGVGITPRQVSSHSRVSTSSYEAETGAGASTPERSPRATERLPSPTPSLRSVHSSPPRSPRSPRSPSPQRPLLMLSRWPENTVDPREPATPREHAIKDQQSHPLRIFYVRAPSHLKAEPTGSEMTRRAARQQLATLRLMGGTARRKNWTKIVFLEWVNATVGAEEARRKSIEDSVKRRKAVRDASALHEPRNRSAIV
jgi:hypothetical protein